MAYIRIRHGNDVLTLDLWSMVQMMVKWWWKIVDFVHCCFFTYVFTHIDKGASGLDSPHYCSRVRAECLVDVPPEKASNGAQRVHLPGIGSTEHVHRTPGQNDGQNTELKTAWFLIFHWNPLKHGTLTQPLVVRPFGLELVSARPFIESSDCLAHSVLLDVVPCGGFHGIPKLAGWFISGKIPPSNGWWRFGWYPYDKTETPMW